MWQLFFSGRRSARTAAPYGQVLLEAVLALALFSMITLGVVALSAGSFSALVQGGDHIQADALSQEAIEAVRAIRDRAFNEIAATSSGVTISGAGDGPATWWNTAYQYRTRITMTIGANSPHNGYENYTVRFADFDTETLIDDGKMQSDCDDLRIAYWNGTQNIEVNRHILGCNATTTDVRFPLQADITASSTDGNYYVYYGAPNAPATTTVMNTVYLWWDDMTADSSSDYTFGSCGGNIYDAWSYNAADYFEIDTRDNGGGCFRRAVNERDAYIEAQWYHTSCQPINMVSGMLGRYVGTGSGSSESATQYYRSIRTHNPQCGGGYSSDGDIIELGGTGIDGTNEAGIVEDQWRTQGFALWGVNNTRGAFWNADTVGDFGPLGWPLVGTTASGTDTDDQESAGDWGVFAHQDTSRVRNMLIRRYTEPEPALSLGAEVEANQWVLRGQGTADTIGKFTRTVSLTNVCRDTSHDIVACPGSYTDVHSLLVTATTSWTPRPGVVNEVVRSSYLTNWDSREWTQTDWDGGSGQSEWSADNQFATSTDVVISTDGQVTLAQGATTCADNSWMFATSTNYTFNADDIEIASSTARLVSPFATDRPTVTPATSFNPPTVDIWLSFTETATKPSGTEVYYQLSADNGSTWQYWDGSAWAAATGTNYNTASVIDDNIWQFSVASSSITFRAFLESNGSAQVSLDTVNIDCRNLQYEIGSVTTDETWASVTFNNTYEAPVAFTIYEESNNTLPASPRIRNLDADGADFRLQHPTSSNLASDVIRYWVIEEGQWMLDDTQLEVHTFDTDTVGHNVNNANSWVADTVTYARTYDAPPLIFHQVQTNNDSDWIVTWTSADGDRTNPPGTTTAQVALNGAEAQSSHDEETVGWMAIEANATGTIGANTFETFRIPDNAGNVGGHDNGCNTTSYQLTYDTAPAAFAYQQEFDGGNGGWTVICSPGNTTEIGFHLEEDQVLDQERAHYAEITGYIAFDGDLTNSADTSFVSPGTIISSAFDTGDDSPMQLIEWDATVPSCTGLCAVRLQIQTALDDNGSPGNWTSTWSGPDGDDGDETDFYTQSGGELIHPDHNGDQWLRWRATIIGDGGNTPTLEEVRINYK